LELEVGLRVLLTEEDEEPRGYNSCSFDRLNSTLNAILSIILVSSMESEHEKTIESSKFCQ
jgi:hypothetical protein